MAKYINKRLATKKRVQPRKKDSRVSSKFSKKKKGHEIREKGIHLSKLHNRVHLQYCGHKFSLSKRRNYKPTIKGFKQFSKNLNTKMRCSIDQWGCKELHASPSQIAFLVAIAFQPIQSKQKELFSFGFYPLLQRKISLLSQLINSQLNLTKA